jgi:Concanavalin A-like lectin/glucanases superfamily
MWIDRSWSRVAACALAVVASLICPPIRAAEGDFVATVVSTHPVAYYRLDATEGKSQVGLTTYKSQGGVTVAGPGAPVGIRNNSAIQLDGHDGWVVTTQAGGVGVAASMMAWVNLAGLPSEAKHFFYIEGESQNGNDLDLQIEDDNVLKFYTAAGGHLSFTPPPASLVNQWHMIVATLDTATHTRVIYWDGKPVATDHGGGEAGKTGLFSVGESTVFHGRFFHGGIAETALWDRALRAPEVAVIFAAANGGTSARAGGSGGAPSMAGMGGRPDTGTGPFATTAKIEVDDSNGPVALKRPEQIAIMFLTAIQGIELDCQLNEKRACPMDVVLGRLKFDPRTDPNYTYTLGANGMAWEAHANAKKPGLMGFCFLSNGLANVKATYNRAGTAGPIDNELSGRSIEGDSFAKQ